MRRALTLSGSLLIGILVLALCTLWLTGLEPGFRAEGGITRPGLWLRGEVVTTPIADWSFVNAIDDPTRKNRFALDAPTVIMVETRTPYLVPHSVTTGVMVRNSQLYIHSHQRNMEIPFPKDKRWTANVGRDPRVRLKIGGKIYEGTAVLVTDPVEVAAVMGRDPATRAKTPDGQERIVSMFHLYRVFQRNVAEFGQRQPANPS